VSADYEVVGDNDAAPFSLKVHRGEGMALLAMDWRGGKPPADFVGFSIEYREPGGGSFYALNNRLGFSPGATQQPTTEAPIQKFRWVHFPRNANLEGDFTYRVTALFMDADGALRRGDAQEAALELRRETYPGQLNVAFTRGFVSSQAFVDRYQPAGPISELVPDDADKGLDFVPTHPKATEALAWMGFEGREAVLGLLAEAVADPDAKVRVVAYDLNQPELVGHLQQLGDRLQVVIDDSGSHGKDESAEHEAEKRLVKSAGRANVKRQHMGGLQHNKMIAVDGPKVQAAIGGSTNFSWRGFYVQSNNAVVARGKSAVEAFWAAFDDYWAHDDAGGFGKTSAAELTSLGLDGIDASVAFSPHASKNAMLAKIADDIEAATSSLLYSMAFLYQTPGKILDAIEKVTNDPAIFVYGISDRDVGGIELQKPDGNVAPVHPDVLSGDLPEPFKEEPVGGSGVRMHHKFAVIDFDKPTARVYTGSYNFSGAADRSNGENLLLVRDRRVAVAYAVEALRIFDHYHFRVARHEAKEGARPLVLGKPSDPDRDGPWWQPYYADAHKIRDREMFA
jgi:hypothetical protein